MKPKDLEGFELKDDDDKNFRAISNHDDDEDLMYFAVVVYDNTNFEASPEKDKTNPCELYVLPVLRLLLSMSTHNGM